MSAVSGSNYQSISSLQSVIEQQQQQLQERPVVLRLNNKSNNGKSEEASSSTRNEKLVNLLQEMTESTLFASFETYLSEWIELFHNLSFDDTSDNEQLRRTIAFFVMEVFYPAIHAEHNDERSLKLISFYTSYKTLIQDLLPQDKTVDEFVLELEKYSQTIQWQRRELRLQASTKIQEATQQAFNKIKQNAQEASQRTVNNFESTNAQLLTLTNNIRRDLEESNEPIEALTQRTIGVVNTQIRNGTTLQSNVRNLEKLNQQRKQALQSLKQTVSEIKI